LKRIIFSVVLVLIFLFTAAGLVKANPVYPGELIMTREDIVITISKVYGKIWAEVNGTYNFSVIMPPSPYSAVMSYPVPPDAEAISVKIDETQLDWTYNGTYYPTFVGDFPFIKWLIEPVPNAFSIKTHYEHSVHIIGGNCTFLYALGTGRYLAEPYWWGCWAYITVYIGKDIAPTGDDIDVYLATKEGVTEPANYSITSLNGMWNVTYVAEAGFKDFLLTIKPHPSPPAANFTWSPPTPKVGEPLTFDASGSLPGWNGAYTMPITEYRWDFGDGNRTTTSTPIIHHRFSSSEIYYVTLTVYAPGATPETDSTTRRVTVIAIPVGGYSISIQVHTKTEPVLPYIALIATLTAIFTKLRPKTKRKH